MGRSEPRRAGQTAANTAGDATRSQDPAGRGCAWVYRGADRRVASRTPGRPIAQLGARARVTFDVCPSAPGRAVPNSANTKRLVIVESPAKAKTISGYLGPNYVVEASFGHVRDLPVGKKDMPDALKSKPWAYLGVDIDNDFAPVYIISADRRKQISRLKELLKQANEVYLATDEDREGEAIAWHLLETLKPKVPVKRMVFHEITRPAIQAAVANPREINRSLVDAQEARRILDRLYGYDVSTVLWKKVQRGLSAGRVQSVATRIVVERERQRMKFRSAEYWDVVAKLLPENDARTFSATLVALDGDRIATGRDFDPETGQVRPGAGVVPLDGDGARGLAARLDGR